MSTISWGRQGCRCTSSSAGRRASGPQVEYRTDRDPSVGRYARSSCRSAQNSVSLSHAVVRAKLRQGVHRNKCEGSRRRGGRPTLASSDHCWRGSRDHPATRLEASEQASSPRPCSSCRGLCLSKTESEGSRPPAHRPAAGALPQVRGAAPIRACSTCASARSELVPCQIDRSTKVCSGSARDCTRASKPASILDSRAGEDGASFLRRALMGECRLLFSRSMRVRRSASTSRCCPLLAHSATVDSLAAR